MAKKKTAPVEEQFVDPNEIVESPAEVIESEESVIEAPNHQALNVKEDLKETLEKFPYIDCVWLNENGDWLFCDRPGFTAYSREQILNG
ncbi:MAG: hypothetical protein WCH59_09310 [Chitinophagia bacterium]|jgi:hypothetical protein